MIKWMRSWDHGHDQPAHQTAWSAGFDLMFIPEKMRDQRARIYPGEMYVANTGWHIQIPNGYCGLIRDRSGTTMRGITTRAGVIDADYRGEIKVVLTNDGLDAVEIKCCDRVAQILFIPYWVDQGIVVKQIDDTTRGIGGFGSTGK